ncbi:MAG: Rab family GTPase [Candidatus Hodarchaeales archaeon]|jgi:small GTP-binding protein
MPKKLILKIAILGDGAVGKTSLINRYMYERFATDYKVTLGVNLLSKDIIIGEDESPTRKPIDISLQIWDIAGQSSFASYRKIYLKDVNCSLLVYDITRPETLDSLIRWHKDVVEFSPGVTSAVLGNKSDLIEERKVTSDQLQKVIRRIKPVDSFESSAKTGEKVNEVFLAIVKHQIGKKIG